MQVLIKEGCRIYEKKLIGNHSEILLFDKKVVFIYANQSWRMKLPYDFIYGKKEEIKAGAVIEIKVRQTGKICRFSFFEDIPEQYQKYTCRKIMHLSSDPGADIFCKDDIVIDTENHTIDTPCEDVGLNGECCQHACYRHGDLLLALNMKIIFGPDFLMIRSTGNRIKLDLFHPEKAVHPIPLVQWHTEDIITEAELPDHIVLKRPERIAAKPMQNTGLMILPSMMMLSSTLLLGIYSSYRAYQNGRDVLDMLPAVLMPGMMLLSTCITYPLINHLQKKRYQKVIKKRNINYQQYLDHTYELFRVRQRIYYFSLYQKYSGLNRILYQLEDHILPSSHDFLLAGWITCQKNIEIESSENEEDAVINDMMQKFSAKINQPVPEPVLISPKSNLLIQGDKKEAVFLSLLIQSALCRKDTVLITDLQFMNEHSWLRRLPGLCSENSRHIYTDDPNEDSLLDHIVFVTKNEWKGRTSVSMADVEREEEMILFASDRSYLCRCRSHAQIPIRLNTASYHFPETALPCRLFNSKETISFLEMYHAENSKDLEIRQRWKRNDDCRTLQTYLGIDEAGQILSLDLSETKNGPHGLIAGTTGSGKSEMILTLLLSLMVNYSPDQLQIAFIDFKGGGASHIFEVLGEPLPHLCGSLSNLDDNCEERVMYALKNECLKRQRMLHDAGTKYHLSIMNLTDYRLLQKKESILERIADLVIVVDEFAELKSQNYEMLKQLISIARIGRSIGIHLILSTQKPAGVVNDQIWANSRFKICLKVSEKQDSMEVLHCPDAVDLKQPGDFIMECDGSIVKGICGYSGTRRSLQKIKLQVIGINGSVEDDYASYGEFDEPEILSVCREITHAWQGHRRVKRLWYDSLQKVSNDELLLHHAIGLIDDYYHQLQPYLIFHCQAGIHWGFLIDDLRVKTGLIRYLCTYIQKECRNTQLLIVDDRDYEGIEKDQKHLTSDELYLMDCVLKDPHQNKIVLISDPERCYNNPKFNIHELMKHAQEYHLQLIFILSQCSSMPYRDQNMIYQRIALKNHSIDEISSFLGTRVERSIQDDHSGYLINEHLLQIRIGIIENDE